MNADSGSSDAARGAGFDRGGSLDSLVARREAAQRRLSSSLRQAELVDRGMRMLEEQLTEYGVPDDDGALHATARALLTIAYGTEAYDVTFLPTASRTAVRVRHTTFGLETEVVPAEIAAPENAQPASAAPDTAHPDSGAPGTSAWPNRIPPQPSA